MLTSRGGAVVARWAHNPKVAGANPVPATKQASDILRSLFFFPALGPLLPEYDCPLDSDKMTPLYEDNHIIIVDKAPGEIVQGDKSGDTPLCETVKAFLKEKYAKPGNVFCGVVHRIDRPVGGLVIFAKTSKALERLNKMLRDGHIHKTYLAIVQGSPVNDHDTLTHYITTVERNNKSYASLTPVENAKKAVLKYDVLARGERYSLLKINLLTGRKHQIRVQLSAIGHPIKGDLKYGAKRSNPSGSISLRAQKIQFTHPVSGKDIDVCAPLPDYEPLFATLLAQSSNPEEFISHDSNI